MNVQSTLTPAPDHDVLIVGAGISGISIAVHLKMLSPRTDFAIVERRENLGGTWDLFRYPGVRSDSDMHSLGFRFEPWIHEKSIADGPAILDYLNKIVDDRGIRETIAFGTKVVAADWRSADARWHVELDHGGTRRTVTARVLYLGSGYYDYDAPFDPAFAGRDDFAGQIVHPQFWPEDLDYAGKKVVVIGSGATAVTIVPAMADKAAHVTMLQRTPTWMGARPAQASAFLTKQAKEALGPAWSDRDFVPPYNPWEQRLCLVPDGDLFEAVRGGRASVVTGTIERFEKDGVRLASGELVAADIIVTATGLAVTMGGKIAITLDGAPIAWNERYFYRGCMFSNVPNLFVVFGYLNASWTLRADNTAEYACGVIEAMRRKGADVVMPVLPEDHGLIDDDIYATFSSGYLQRGKATMPKNADRLPWRLNMDYFADRRDFRERPVDDGVLAFSKARVPESA